MARKKVAPPEFPQVFETFSKPNNITISTEPSATNSIRIRKYRVTVEEVQEPIEVLQERLLWLWHRNANQHEREHLKREATKLGYVLPSDEYGQDAQRRH